MDDIPYVKYFDDNLWYGTSAILAHPAVWWHLTTHKKFRDQGKIRSIPDDTGHHRSLGAWLNDDVRKILQLNPGPKEKK